MASKKNRKKRFTEPKKQPRKKSQQEIHQEKQIIKYNKLRDWFREGEPMVVDAAYSGEGE